MRRKQYTGRDSRPQGCFADNRHHLPSVQPGVTHPAISSRPNPRGRPVQSPCGNPPSRPSAGKSPRRSTLNPGFDLTTTVHCMRGGHFKKKHMTRCRLATLQISAREACAEMPQ
ncbi:hypothetical protein SAMCFNEI73_Ch1645 [Sinorhizobium americanum]|uniref:Uncharacterized protein n=1 Tax=Sinorhizobium americanum TaxID=194963 RepID=A0A1L3LLM0_9HYPH|nr:hypothetical protein SAMCFNEI73_Ch1645 [Sinorhizobium americanum]